MVWDLIGEDLYLSENFDGHVNTPLYIAASMGQIVFGLEVLRLKPCFATKLNPNGMHLAIRDGHARMAELMLDGNIHLIRIPRREGITPFPCVAEIGDVYLLNKFCLPFMIKTSNSHS